MADGVVIRAAQESDVNALAAMNREFEEYLNALADAPIDTVIPPINAEAFRRDGFGQDAWFSGLLAERDGRPLGYLLYHFGYWSDAAAGALFVADLFVRVEARRQGVGKKLMAKAAQILRDRGGTAMLWSVWDRNSAAQAFYERLGATPIKEERLMYWSDNAWP